ncbi:MAG: hypothetical protein QMC67_05560 [Candidatus Wallbacteria bacterium]
MMKKEIGLWIDHKRAFIVTLMEKNEETKEIFSNLEKHLHLITGSFDYSEEDHLDRKFANQLKKYYDEIVENVIHSDSVFIFGPGNAKIELEKNLKNANYQGKMNIESSDKMTDPQIAAKVKNYFHKSKMSMAM